METAAMVLSFVVSGVGFFLAGARWGTVVKEFFVYPNLCFRLVAGQKWSLPGVGNVRVVTVWSDSVSYYSTKAGQTSVILVMNRDEFNVLARNEDARDPLGNFHKSIKNRVFPFELREGGRK